MAALPQLLVYDTLTDSALGPIPNALVEITLNAPQPSCVNPVVALSQTTIQAFTNGQGLWFVVVIPIDFINPPSSFYTVKVQGRAAYQIGPLAKNQVGGQAAPANLGASVTYTPTGIVDTSGAPFYAALVGLPVTAGASSGIVTAVPDANHLTIGGGWTGGTPSPGTFYAVGVPPVPGGPLSGLAGGWQSLAVKVPQLIA